MVVTTPRTVNHPHAVAHELEGRRLQVGADGMQDVVCLALRQQAEAGSGTQHDGRVCLMTYNTLC